VGFPIAIALYLLYERTKTFEVTKEELKALNQKWAEMNSLLLEVVKGNTAAQVDLRVTIQKLCEIVGAKI
jgi:hypothetical protein